MTRWTGLFQWRERDLGRSVTASDFTCENFRDCPSDLLPLLVKFRHLRQDARASAIKTYYLFMREASRRLGAHMSFKSYASMDNMLEDLRKQRAVADALVRKDQILSPGDYYIHYAEEAGLFVYGKILDPAAETLAGRELSELDEEEASEYDYVRTVYSEPHMKFYRFARAHSPICEEGELGDIHLCTVHRQLTEDQFRQFKEAQWPQDVATVRQILLAAP